ncbi:MAG: YD repeat protein [Parcubacteria group bacterium GW2011_GWA2_51_10]|nr:MAG: YD repeat protein [Parcubacteria group bacterium GW2011_GWA2_51_10]
MGDYAYAGTNYANPHAATQIGTTGATTTFTYDSNGNMETGGIWTYGWDYRNRLTSAGDGTATTTFGYDYSGQRVFQTTASTTTLYPSKYFSIASSTSGSAATSTSYIYAGDTLLAYVEQGLVNGTATGTPSTFYVHPDHLGSTNVITNASGTVVTSKDYYPYGSTRIESGDASLARGYIGQFEDQNLLYLQARYMDPIRGQFTSQDPVFWEDPKKQNLMNPQSLNSYGYANGNPIVNKDPNGRCVGPLAIPCIGAGAGIVGQFGYDLYNNYQANGFDVGSYSFSSGETYLTRAAQGASIATVGVLTGGMSIPAQVALIGGTSGATGALGNLYLGDAVTPQSVFWDTTIGGVTFGLGKFVPGIPGRLPNFGTQAFFTGKHTQQSAMQLGVGAISNYTSQILGSSNTTGGGSSAQAAAKAMGIGNTGSGTFVGTYNFGPGVGTFNFGTGSWTSTAQTTPATSKK